MWYGNSIMNIVTDFAIFHYRLCARFKTAKSRRLSSYLCSGSDSCKSLPCAISIVRIQTLKTAATSKDPTRGNVAAECWTITELACGIVCACIPTLRPLAAKFFPGVVPTAARPYSHYEMQSEPKGIRFHHIFDIADGSKDNLLSVKPNPKFYCLIALSGFFVAVIMNMNSTEIVAVGHSTLGVGFTISLLGQTTAAGS
ncbi:hypothetical protein BCR34DRAFT_573594 [Clohesyomyces aquaticus]|uniref:Rhodopsin domain-containing protein n=1 Tax=Clohesyomyces aquaticus TaxID=1231657 RepID=A0A1Y1YZ52_9PLEO|nr:hypothetical protein BCR34DRAFT_573594 [Clohesyomyces aquaticus]